MKQHILIEQIKTAIGGRKIQSAVFFTFNFDPAFFENYILPVCVSLDIPFSNNHVQNKMLWYQYEKELPPVAVICDYYTKNNSEPPSLNYDVFCIAKSKNFFHPKNMFFLCDDGRLILVTGSANLSYSGWCHNAEVISVLHFEPTEHSDELASDVKQFFDFISFSLVNDKKDNGRAIVTISNALSKAKLINDTKQKFNFYGSINGPFIEFIKQLQDRYNQGERFQEVEVISPFLAGNVEDFAKHYSSFTSLSSQKVKLALPYKAAQTSSISKDLYDAIPGFGFTWQSPCFMQDEKNFRHLHGKLYRFMGNESIITIIGSVNFTTKGFIGISRDGNINSGNYESAIAIIEPLSQWNSLFQLASPAQPFFDNEQGKDSFLRPQVPDLSFSLDWNAKSLEYEFIDKWKGGTCVALIGSRQVPLRKVKDLILLNQDELESFASQCIIKVLIAKSIEPIPCEYFIKQINYSCKPVPPKYRLTPQQIFDIWAMLGDTDNHITSRQQFIERCCSNRINESEEIDDIDLTGGSTLNTMSQHLAGILNLKDFISARNKNISNDRKKEQIQHYLFNESIDTLPHYLQGLKSLLPSDNSQGKISNGFYWLILTIVNKIFYTSHDGLISKEAVNNFNIIHWLENERKAIKKKIAQDQDIDDKLLRWVEKNI